MYLHIDGKIDETKTVGERASTCHYFDPYGFPMQYVGSEVAKLAGEVGATHVLGSRFKMSIDVIGDHPGFVASFIEALGRLPVGLRVSDDSFNIYTSGRLVGSFYLTVQ